MSRQLRVRPARKPRVAPTAEAIYEMIAYMQRERHLIRHLVERFDRLEREVKRLAAEQSYREEWTKLARDVRNLRDDFRRAHAARPPLPPSPR